MPVQPLTPDKLRLVCDPDELNFETTAEFGPLRNIIGQPRGTRAIQFGINIQSEGYNIYALGRTGTGRATAIEHFLQRLAQERPTPDDWVYVHNFSTPHKPRAIEFPPSEGAIFKERMTKLINGLHEDLPKAYQAETYQESIAKLNVDLEQKKSIWLNELHVKAGQQGFSVLNTPSGLMLAPMQNGQPLPPQAFQQLTAEKRQALETTQRALMVELQDILERIRYLEEQIRTQMKEIDRSVAETAVRYNLDNLKEIYATQEEVLLYLDELHEDIIHQIDDFAPPVESGQEIDLRRYEVNLLVDRMGTEGAPVVVEQNPMFHNLIGRLEYEMQAGIVTTHFTNIKPGSLHQANGGYLIMNAADVLRDGRTWEALKRALRGKHIDLRQFATMDGSQVLAKSLDPEPIPLDVKIILMGSPDLYYYLYDNDEDFATLFKVRADFDSMMPRSAENMQEYVKFVATMCHEEKLCHFDKTAVAKIIEYGSWLVEDQAKLSAEFGKIADLIREASFWAGENGRDIVTAADVSQTLAERTQRGNLIETRLRDRILENAIFIATEGEIVGQVNGLTVLDMGEYSFGQPGRITARSFMGDDGITHIERETQMSGPIHEKGVMTLRGYLGGKYAQKQPLSVSLSVTFEQSYSLVDGDSASSTELYAILSTLSYLPIKQGIAVTGSVNQRGEVQPIGGVNEKIEGFFRICEARGLTGEQGVMIPLSNVVDLMLPEDVVTAVANKQFYIWPISTIDEGIELLLGVPAGTADKEGNYPEGTVHYLVQKHLLQLAQDLKAFGDSKHDDDSDDEEEDEDE
jgi:lon-related putative ATP-dependent protease